MIKVEYEVICCKKEVALNYEPNDNQWVIVTKYHHISLGYKESCQPILQFMYNKGSKAIEISTSKFLYENKTYCGSEFGDEISEEEFQTEFENVLKLLKDNVNNINL